MADIGLSTILRCGLCHKPFDKQSTFKRHGYYCRSRQGHNQLIRPRSCIACAKAKARCDNILPNCTRCTTKKLECHARGLTTSRRVMLGDSGKELQTVRHLAQERSWKSTPNDNHHAGSDIDLLATGIVNDMSDLANFRDDQFTWDLPDLNISDIRDEDSEIVRSSLLSSPCPLLFDQPAALVSPWFQSGQMVPTADTSIPKMPTYALRSFGQNPAIKDGAQTTAVLMNQILASYPSMMERPDSLPPFIHPYCLFNVSETDSKSLDSLTTCMSLMQMIGTGIPGSRKLLWKNVRSECERLSQEWAILDRRRLLSAMQALLIYILLRLQEGETMYNNFDVLLLSTVWKVAYAMNQQVNHGECVAPCGLRVYGPSQEDWVFEESGRRMATVFGSLKLLFSMEPADQCGTSSDFLLAPLPARKPLWEARTEILWRIEKSRDVGPTSVYGLTVDGHMVKMNEHDCISGAGMILKQAGASTVSGTNWQDYCAGMDGLGALVMLAASLSVQTK